MGIGNDRCQCQANPSPRRTHHGESDEGSSDGWDIRLSVFCSFTSGIGPRDVEGNQLSGGYQFLSRFFSPMRRMCGVEGAFGWLLSGGVLLSLRQIVAC
jgi:hypothetical protein